MSSYATQSNIQMTAPGIPGRASAGAGKSKLLTASELIGLLGTGSGGLGEKYLADDATWKTIIFPAHNQAWSTITATPTTLVGYGITDAYPLIGNPSGFLTGVTIADGSITLAKLADMATASVYYRKTAATGVPEVQSLATLKTDLGLTGTNSGDQNVFTTIAVSGQSDVVSDSASDTLTLVAGTNISITTVAGTDTITITNTASGLSGTGSVDNAVLRADGTGGATLQGSALLINDLATASPNNTVNNLSLTPTGGTTNVSLSIVPKGTGAFCLAVPDGTATGGNARGSKAVDLQLSRASAAQVASGNNSAVIGGVNNSATGSYAVVCCGESNFASGQYSGILAGSSNQTSGFSAVVLNGDYNYSSGYASTLVAGTRGSAYLNGHLVVGFSGLPFGLGGSAYSGQNLTGGPAQWGLVLLSVLTTNATPSTMMTGTSGTGGARRTVRNGYLMLCDILVSGIKSDGSASCCYKRKVAIKNVANTTTLVGTVDVIGVDQEDNVLTDIAITADNVNKALQINVTGIAAETWRWVAVVQGLEIAYGT